jgi:hypothetical protein
MRLVGERFSRAEHAGLQLELETRFELVAEKFVKSETGEERLLEETMFR